MSDTESQQQIDAAYGREMDLSASQSSQRAAVAAEVDRKSRRRENPRFLDKAAQADLDSDMWDWLENEFGPLLSKQHMLANRRPAYERQSELLDANRVEREMARHNLGRGMREHPDVYATAMGYDWSPDRGLAADPDARTHWGSSQREVARDVADVSTARKSMGVGAKFLDALTTATTEHIQRRSDEASGRSVKSRLAEVLD
jgi:hypothetical protein